MRSLIDTSILHIYTSPTISNISPPYFQIGMEEVKTKKLVVMIEESNSCFMEDCVYGVRNELCLLIILHLMFSGENKPEICRLSVWALCVVSPAQGGL